MKIMSATGVFDDETSALLMSYPKTTVNREETQKDMTLGSSQSTMTQRMRQMTHLMMNNQEKTSRAPEQLFEEEKLILGFLSDVSQSQGLMTGGSNFQNIISEAKLAIQEYDKEQLNTTNDFSE